MVEDTVTTEETSRQGVAVETRANAMGSLRLVAEEDIIAISIEIAPTIGVITTPQVQTIA